MRHHPNQIVATTRSWSLIRFGAIFGALGLYLFIVSDALAQGGGAQRVGKNLGDQISAFGGYIMFGLAGMMIIGMIASRKVNGVGVVLVMVFIGGGMFFAGDELTRIITNTWRAIGRGA